MNTTTYHGVIDLDGGTMPISMNVDDGISRENIKKLMMGDLKKSYPKAYLAVIESESELQKRIESERQFIINRPMMKKNITEKLTSDELKFIKFL